MGVGLVRNTPGSKIRSVQNKDPNPLPLAAPTLNIWDWWRIYQAFVLGLLTSYLLHVIYIAPPFPLTSAGPQQQHEVNPAGVFLLTLGCQGDGGGGQKKFPGKAPCSWRFVVQYMCCPSTTTSSDAVSLLMRFCGSLSRCFSLNWFVNYSIGSWGIKCKQHSQLFFALVLGPSFVLSVWSLFQINLSRPLLFKWFKLFQCL